LVDDATSLMYIIAAILQLIPGRDLRAERLSFQTRLTAFVFAARIEVVTMCTASIQRKTPERSKQKHQNRATVLCYKKRHQIGHEPYTHGREVRRAKNGFSFYRASLFRRLRHEG
jgi:hypothetical protein